MTPEPPGGLVAVVLQHSRLLEPPLSQDQLSTVSELDASDVEAGLWRLLNISGLIHLVELQMDALH